MARKPTVTAAVPPPLTKTFRLAVTIRDDKGQEYRELTLVEPELQHRVKVQRSRTATETERTIGLIAALAGVPEAAVRRLKTRDAFRIKSWIDEIAASGVMLDMAAEKEGGVTPEDELDSERTFSLMAPIETNAAPILHLTVREPDLEAGIAVERMDTVGEQTAALIASCSGQIIPVVMRMKLRDVARVERWLSFFSLAGEPPAEEASTDAEKPSTAGATLL
jgi:hypothetical protein